MKDESSTLRRNEFSLSLAASDGLEFSRRPYLVIVVTVDKLGLEHRLVKMCNIGYGN
jgi:hypothetical protein